MDNTEAWEQPEPKKPQTIVPAQPGQKWRGQTPAVVGWKLTVKRKRRKRPDDGWKPVALAALTVAGVAVAAFICAGTGGSPVKEVDADQSHVYTARGFVRRQWPDAKFPTFPDDTYSVKELDDGRVIVVGVMTVDHQRVTWRVILTHVSGDRWRGRVELL